MKGGGFLILSRVFNKNKPTPTQASLKYNNLPSNK